MRRALIVGVTGQDGAYLARLLLARNYRVWGTSRDAATADRAGLADLGIDGEVIVETMDATDALSVAAVFETATPDEVYDLRGPTALETGLAKPVETFATIVGGTQTLIETIRSTRPATRLFSAGSAASFGNPDGAANETTPLRPTSPFGAAKASAGLLVAAYRASYGLFAVTGVLFDHASRLQSSQSITATIIRGAQAIAAGRASGIELADVDTVRDFGWAPEYVDAMWRALQAEQPQDYVIATGESMTVRTFARHVFEIFGLDLDRYLHAPAIQGPRAAIAGRADPARARSELGWRAYTAGRELAQVLCDGYRTETPQ